MPTLLKDQGYMFYGQNFEPDSNATETAETTKNGVSSTNGVAHGKPGLKQRQSGGKGYLLPVDTDEIERLDAQHELYLLATDGKLGRAPVCDPRRVLEIATGTGVWALEYATANPSCHVTGTDISAFQRTHPLPNLNFVLHDFEKDAWPAQYGGDYDYIHLRYTVTCFDSTPEVLRRAFKLLRPGGWIEFYDPNHVYLPVDRPLEGTALGKWMSSVVEGARRVGRDFLKPTKYVGWMRDAGFTNVTETRFGFPTNPWVKDARLKQMGRLNVKNEVAVVGSLGKTLRLAVEDEKEAEALEEGARRDVQDPSMHFFREMFVVYAQKPEET
ncbi:hypothetical protein E4U17_000080 [Claviceps sp. LM77 group G4]|nr:hypothetical protein E4U17_000080 [Claviceps sp. LM77 group G4]KAG6085240.1 hypothetical protein E4U16_006830 [Claviceps sp. LM84 group G4]KAG6086082.1 hypothetical protein E4U33_000079 [Claviceps sp. LM78 group G4]